MAGAERRDGRWRARWVDGAGQRRYKGGFAHKAAAERYAHDQEAISRRVTGDPSITWGQWLPRWERLRRVETSTLVRDRQRIDTHIEPRWGTRQLRRITSADVQAWVNDLDNGDRSPNTVRRVFHTFAASMKAAVKYGLLPYSPCEHIELPISPPGVEHYLDEDAQKKLLHDHITSDRVRLIVETLLGTGMRWSEMAGLHVDHIDFDLEVVYVSETLDRYRSDTQRIKPYPKGKRARVVPITTELAGALRAHVARRAAKGCGVKHAAGRPCRSELVFRTAEGKPLNYPEFVKAYWSPAVKQARKVGDLDGPLRIHDLRHTWASRLARAGISEAALADIGGWASLNMVRRYSHFGNSQHDAVRAALRGRNGDAVETPERPRMIHGTAG